MQDARNVEAVRLSNPEFRRRMAAERREAAEAERQAAGDPRQLLAHSHQAESAAETEVARLAAAVARAQGLVAQIRGRRAGVQAVIEAADRDAGDRILAAISAPVLRHFMRQRRGCADNGHLAAARIRAALDEVGVGAGDLGPCSGASGVDLLFAEAASSAGSRVELRLARAENEFLAESVTFADPDRRWEHSFVQIKENPATEVLVMPEETRSWRQRP